MVDKEWQDVSSRNNQEVSASKEVEKREDPNAASSYIILE